MTNDSRTCALCGQPIVGRRSDARFCSRKCAHKVWITENQKRPMRTGTCGTCGRTWTELSRQAPMRKNCPDCWPARKLANDNAWRRRFAAENPDEFKARVRAVNQRQWADPEKRQKTLAANRQWALENPDKTRAYKRRSRQNNPATARLTQARRRQRKLGTTPNGEKVDFPTICERDQWTCQL